MRDATLAVYLFGHNLIKIAYPFRESIRSALAIADRVFFCECDSEDETLEAVEDMVRNDPNGHRITILQHPWAQKFYANDQAKIDQEGYKIQAHIANFMLNEIGDKYDFGLKLDADEVLCEWSFDRFRQDLKILKDNGFILARPWYTHFSPDDRTTIPFIYKSKAVISRLAVGLRFGLGKGSDACALGGAPEIQTHLEIHHYGKMGMGRRAQALFKERDFASQLYKSMGFPDPKVEAQAASGVLDYKQVFDENVFTPYRGEHPVFVQQWLADMRKADE